MSGAQPDPKLLQEKLDQGRQILGRIDSAIGRTVLGQDQLRRRLMTALITENHLLLEGVPGLAKTLSIKALAQSVAGSFQRIQFTPDLLPADVIGTEIYRPQEGRFDVRRGPIFANFVLADEINRAPAKVQSALLETMQERQVTIGETTFPVPSPFLVMATQNPIEQEGTYPLPEAQIDRFLMKVTVSYPDPQSEKQMLDVVASKNWGREKVEPVATLEDIGFLSSLAEEIYIDESLKQYIVDLVRATRDPALFGLKLDNLIELGASPRASLSLFVAARAEAVLAGEQFVVPQHIKDIAPDVLRHRILPTYEAEAQGLTADDLIVQILNGVPVP